MDKPIKVIAKIIDGRLEFNQNQLDYLLAEITEMEVDVVISKHTEKRSLNQNAYYWAVVIPAIQRAIRDTGERLNLIETEKWITDFLSATDKDFTHQFLKEKFSEKITVDEATGEITELQPSTKRMNKEQFTEYLSRVIQFANETLEIEIPSSTIEC